MYVCDIHYNLCVHVHYIHVYEIHLFHRIINTIYQIKALSISNVFLRANCFFLGQKFPKSLNANLEATVVFTDAKSPSSFDDPFCTDQNTYAQVKTCILYLSIFHEIIYLNHFSIFNHYILCWQLFFKIPDFTHSGCCIDSKSIQVSPSTKFKLNTGTKITLYCLIW